MGFLGLGKKKKPVEAQPEVHIVYGTGLDATEALSAARRNLPPNAVEGHSKTYPVGTIGTIIEAEIPYTLKPALQPVRAHGAAAPSPLQEILYRGK